MESSRKGRKVEILEADLLQLMDLLSGDAFSRALGHHTQQNEALAEVFRSEIETSKETLVADVKADVRLHISKREAQALAAITLHAASFERRGRRRGALGALCLIGAAILSAPLWQHLHF